MSWWIAYKNREDFALDQREPGSATDLSDSAGEQFVAARDAATLLIERGVVGPEGKEFGITISGHATPGHLAEDGSSPDSVTVAIYQRNAQSGT